MPPRRDPDNSNNKDQESRTEAMMQQMMAAQTQLMTMMAQFMANQNNQQQLPPPPQVDRLTRFPRLRTNKFTMATEPIMADDYLRIVHGNLVTCECTDAEMVRFTAHLLEA